MLPLLQDLAFSLLQALQPASFTAGAVFYVLSPLRTPQLTRLAAGAVFLALPPLRALQPMLAAGFAAGAVLEYPTESHQLQNSQPWEPVQGESGIVIPDSPCTGESGIASGSPT